MRVLFITPSFYPAIHYGGPTFINRSFCRALADEETIQLQVLTTDANGPERINPQLIETENYAILFCRRIFRPDIAPGLLWRLFGMIRAADVVHLNAVYSFTTIPTLLICRLLQRPVLWTPFGGLQRWEGTKRRRVKRLWERICDGLCEPARVRLHMTSEEEKRESLEKIHNVDAVLLRNGIDIPRLNRVKSCDPGNRLRLLFIGRLHPIKGIENLLHALVHVKADFHLSIAGEGEPDYEKHLISLVIELGLSEAVTFHGRVDGDDKERCFAEADLCIAPSFKEAFCTVVLESLARSVPVIASRGTPWESVNEMGCGIWTSNRPAALAEAINRAAALNLSEMGRRGRGWMKRDYSWEQVCRETIEEYRRLIDASGTLREESIPQTV